MKILEVIVTYKPNLDLLMKSILSTKNQVEKILVIDNSDVNESVFNGFLVPDNVEIKELHENIGIAEATNIAIRYGIENNYDWILTSDQDTVYPEDYIENFIRNYEVLREGNNKIIGFSPVYFDRNTGVYGELFEWNGQSIAPIISEETNTKILAAIASGLIINLHLIEEVGLMNSDLFIDWVDLDWCYRAYFLGYDLIGCKDLKISHCLGDTSKSLFGKQITLRNPLRHYYIIRNCEYLSLYELSYPKEFRDFLHKKVKTYLAGYFYLAKPHFKNLKYLIRGIKDAKNKRMGKCSLLREKK